MKQLIPGILLLAVSALAQQPAGFDVASIKPSSPDTHGMSIGITPGGSFKATGVTLKSLLMQAYNVRDFQVSGGPGWIDTDRYDILTKSEGPAVSEADLGGMTDQQRNAFRDGLLAKVRLLLADRFQLKIHKETKELPVYGLVIAKSGSKLTTAVEDGKPGGSMSMSRGDTGKSVMTARKMEVESLARQLSNQVGRTVLDQTGLTGKYDFKMTWAPDLAETSSEGPSLFTALQDQLGLKLDAQKGPVEIIVIDSVQKASEN